MKIQGGLSDEIRERFYSKTEISFVSAVSTIVNQQKRNEQVEIDWLTTLTNTALKIFDAFILNAITEKSLKDTEVIINQRKKLKFSVPKKIKKILEIESVRVGV